ncbi:MAG: transporter [Bacteroidales bacterium]|nr:transporter [Bacteroidales bacterium]
MPEKAVRFLKDWMLPIVMVLGVSIYLLLHYLAPAAEESYIGTAKWLQPTLISIMLFLQLAVVSPKDLRLHRWHLVCILAQTLLFAGFAYLCITLPEGNGRILSESAMLCFIAPTAVAAGVIASRIGGNISSIITYTVLIDVLVSLLIPAVIPLIHPETDVRFVAAFFAIIRKVAAILVLPCALAWFIRYALPGLQRRLERCVGWAFYIWGVGLTLAMSLATRSLVTSGIVWWVIVCIGLISLASCLFQFWLGRRLARGYGRAESITAGQALGQKNNGFIIWLGFTYLTPVCSVAGGLYAIWHNLVNSWELYEARKGR